LPETADLSGAGGGALHFALRDRYDPSARRNVPAHVTVLYPFMPPDHIDESVIDALRGIAHSVPSFCIAWRNASFPGGAVSRAGSGRTTWRW
jgi:hypothetical protein